MSGTRTFRNRRTTKWAAMLVSLSLASPVFAIPQQDDFTSVSGGATYLEGAGEGTLNLVNDHSVVAFGANGVGAEGFDVPAGETFNVNGSSGWNVLINDTSGGISDLSGHIDGNSNINMFVVNPAGIVFGAGFTFDLASLVSSTLSIDTADFIDGDSSYSFSTPGAPAAITVHGLRSLNPGADASLIAGAVLIDGSMDVEGGNANIVVADQVTMSYDSNQMIQFDVTAGVQSAVGSTQGVAIDSAGSITAGNVTIESRVGDAVSLAINHEGVIRAQGIATEGGVIRLLAPGSRVESVGTVDARGEAGGPDGAIQIAAKDTFIKDGFIAAGQGGSLDVGVGVGNNESFGSFTIAANTEMDAGQVSIVGEAQNNVVSGLSNYVVDGADAGSADYGVDNDGNNTGNNNVGDIQFQNIGGLVAGELNDNILVTETGSVSLGISGSTGNDTFIVRGSAASLRGQANDDVFDIQGGTVGEILGGQDSDTIIVSDGATITSIDGGGAIDTLRNVVDPTINGASGFSNEVTMWSSIEQVIPFVPPSPVPPTPVTPTPTGLSTLIVPTTPAFNINSLNNVSLGLIGDGNNLRLPCAYMQRDRLQTTDEALAAAEEIDCMDPYATPEYQDLLATTVYFSTDKSFLTDSATTRLGRVAQFVIDSERFSGVVIAGHTDDVASEPYNLALSERRAASVQQFLRELGVSDSLFRRRAYGESLPAVPNTDSESRSLNRRVEVTLIE